MKVRSNSELDASKTVTAATPGSASTSASSEKGSLATDWRLVGFLSIGSRLPASIHSIIGISMLAGQKKPESGMASDAWETCVAVADFNRPLAKVHSEPWTSSLFDLILLTVRSQWYRRRCWKALDEIHKFHILLLSRPQPSKLIFET